MEVDISPTLHIHQMKTARASTQALDWFEPEGWWCWPRSSHHQPIRRKSRIWSSPAPWAMTTKLLTEPSRSGHRLEGISSLWQPLPGKTINAPFSCFTQNSVSEIQFGVDVQRLSATLPEQWVVAVDRCWASKATSMKKHVFWNHPWEHSKETSKSEK